MTRDYRPAITIRAPLHVSGVICITRIAFQRLKIQINEFPDIDHYTNEMIDLRSIETKRKNNLSMAVSGIEPGPPDWKSKTLTTTLRDSLLKYCCKLTVIYYLCSLSYVLNFIENYFSLDSFSLAFANLEEFLINSTSFFTHATKCLFYMPLWQAWVEFLTMHVAS